MKKLLWVTAVMVFSFLKFAFAQEATQAKHEEHALMRQIKEAANAGDFETARKLKEEFKAMHQENIRQKQQDRDELHKAYNSPGVGPRIKDRLEDIRDRREDIKDRREDIRDRREDIKDKREDIKDRREDVRDRREDVRDRREDIRDKSDRGLHRGEQLGVRDRGQGVGAGRGQGGMHRSGGGGPRHR